ncbi:MAG: hypothetical protein RSB57_04095 [Hungatella sp.]
MIYICERCGFIFYRVGAITHCPFCEQERIRFATEQEEQELIGKLTEPETLIISKERVS